MSLIPALQEAIAHAVDLTAMKAMVDDLVGRGIAISPDLAPALREAGEKMKLDLEAHVTSEKVAIALAAVGPELIDFVKTGTSEAPPSAGDFG